MERKRASDFDQELLDLYDGYVHGAFGRRELFERAAKFAVGGLTVATLVESLLPNYAWASQVEEDDARIRTERVEYQSPDGHGAIRAYVARPAGSDGPFPGVVVVHENRGLNPYIEDVARRLGAAGFLAVAPDGLSPLGGYPGNDEEGRAMQKKLDRGKLTEDFIAAFRYLESRDDCTGKIGAVGFCYGGGVVNAMAVRLPELGAAVPFYGRQPAGEDVVEIQAPLLLHYAGLDERVNEGWPAYEAALKENGKRYNAHFYDGVNHGFHNDTTPRYDEAAANLAWERTVAFFDAELGEQ